MRGPGIDNRFMVPTRVKIEMEAPHEPEGRATPLPGALLRRMEEREKSRRSIQPCASIVAALALLVTVSCGRNENRADLTIINGKEPETLDPGIVVGQADGRVVLALFEGLTRYEPESARAVPGLAERWEISPDGREYVFYLRTNAVWSTGEPIEAEDVAYSWLRVLDPATGADYAGNLYYIKNAEEYNNGRLKDPRLVGVHTLGRTALKVELINPTPFFLDLCAFPTQAVVPRQAIEKHGDAWLKKRPLPVSGAYELVSWRLNDKIRVRKNPRYWDAANTRTELVDLLPSGLSSTALNLFETGGADIIWDKDLVPSELLDILRRRADFHTFDYLASYFYRYNTKRKPFDDPRVRKALALAINKERIVQKITRGGEKAASHLVPPGIPHYTPPEGLGYDPNLARKLLAEAGYPDGQGFRDFEYHFNTSRDHEKIGVELQDMWRKELGIHCNLRAEEWKVYLRSQAELNYDLTRSSWIGDYTDPNTFLDTFISSNPNNRTGWNNPKYDELIRTGNALVDPKAREHVLQEAELLIVKEDLPIVPLYIYVGFNFFNPKKISGVFNNLRDEHPLRSIRKAPK